MFAAILFAVSMAALGQFGLYYWRAVVAGVAAQPLSDRVLKAAGLASESVGAADFRAVINVHDLTPALKDDNGGLRLVRAYYSVVEALGRVAGMRLPALATWTQREMATCSRYVAVLVDQRLERNLACAAEARSS
jgi:ATP-dependent exoDNAse (exonuclease V) alpha subunit